MQPEKNTNDNDIGNTINTNVNNTKTKLTFSAINDIEAIVASI